MEVVLVGGGDGDGRDGLVIWVLGIQEKLYLGLGRQRGRRSAVRGDRCNASHRHRKGPGSSDKGAGSLSEFAEDKTRLGGRRRRCERDSGHRASSGLAEAAWRTSEPWHAAGTAKIYAVQRGVHILQRRVSLGGGLRQRRINRGGKDVIAVFVGKKRTGRERFRVEGEGECLIREAVDAQRSRH